MRGRFSDQSGLFSYIRHEDRILAALPLRRIRDLVRAVLRDLSPRFSRLYAREGRPSIPPEQLLSALLLQAFFGIRSERAADGVSVTVKQDIVSGSDYRG
jgi:transposase